MIPITPCTYYPTLHGYIIESHIIISIAPFISLLFLPSYPSAISPPSHTHILTPSYFSHHLTFSLYTLLPTCTETMHVYHTPSIPIFQLHQSAYFSHSFTISPIGPGHAWIHTYISPWTIPLAALYIHISHGTPSSICCWCLLSQHRMSLLMQISLGT